jgi:zinc protease
LGDLTATLLPKKTRGETVSLALTLRYGDEESLKPFATAVEFLPSLMIRGTQKLSYQELKDELDKNRAVLAATGDVGSATFRIQTKREFLPAVLNLLKDVLREPALADSEFEVLKQEQLAALEQNLTEPQALASVDVRKRLSPYPADDVRYVASLREDIERVQALTGEDVRRLYSLLGGDAGELAIVGDFEPAEVISWAESTLEGWSRKQPYRRVEYQAFPEYQTGRVTFNTPDKANCVYFAGQTFAMKDDHPEYPALVLGNYVLGGSPAARLFDRVRQREGLSYGVGSSLSARTLDPRAAITVFAITNPQNAEKVATAIQEEIDRILQEPMGDEELALAKDGYLKSQQISRADDQALASMLNSAAFAGRTLQFDADQEARISALTGAEIQAALKKYIDPEKFALAIAGDFSGEEDKPAGAN